MIPAHLGTSGEEQQVSALLFDLGGVLFQNSFDRAFETWASFSDLTKEEMKLAFSFDDAYQRHERGELLREDYFDHLRETLRLRGSDDEIEIGWNAIFLEEIPSTLKLVQDARRRLPCFAFSNSNLTHRAWWMAKYPTIVQAFDHVFISCDIGLRKPDAAAFEFIAKSIGTAPESILFFDDTLENVTGASAAGLKAVHVRESNDVERALLGLAGTCGQGI